MRPTVGGPSTGRRLQVQEDLCFTNHARDSYCSRYVLRNQETDVVVTRKETLDVAPLEGSALAAHGVRKLRVDRYDVLFCLGPNDEEDCVTDGNLPFVSDYYAQQSAAIRDAVRGRAGGETFARGADRCRVDSATPLRLRRVNVYEVTLDQIHRMPLDLYQPRDPDNDEGDGTTAGTGTRTRRPSAPSR